MHVCKHNRNAVSLLTVRCSKTTLTPIPGALFILEDGVSFSCNKHPEKKEGEEEEKHVLRSIWHCASSVTGNVIYV